MSMIVTDNGVCCAPNPIARNTFVAVATILAVVAAIFLAADLFRISASVVGYPLLITATIIAGLPAICCLATCVLAGTAAATKTL